MLILHFASSKENVTRNSFLLAKCASCFEQPFSIRTLFFTTSFLSVNLLSWSWLIWLYAVPRVFIEDGSSEHGVHLCRKSGLFLIILYLKLLSMLTTALNKSNYLIHSKRAHRIMSYHLMTVTFFRNTQGWLLHYKIYKYILLRIFVIKLFFFWYRCIFLVKQMYFECIWPWRGWEADIIQYVAII